MAAEEEILIKLRRHYDKDEYVKVLLRVLKQKNFELAQYKSLDEEILSVQKTNQALEMEITNLKKILNNANKSIKQSKIYKDLKSSNEAKRKQIKELQIFRDKLLQKLNWQ